MNMYIVLQLVLLSVVQSSLQSCSLQPPPIVEDLKQKPIPAQNLNGHIIVPFYNFTCYGVITSWEARITGRMSDIRFQVWKLVTGRTYSLVGENYIRVRPTRFPIDKLLYEVSTSLQIQVSPGDFIGIFIGGGDVKIRSEASQDVHTFVANVEGPLNSFREPLILDPSFNSHLMVAPQLTIHVDEVPAPTAPEDSTNTTSMPSTLTIETAGTDGVGQDSPQYYTLIIGVTVSAATLVGVCVGIIIITIILCFVKNKKPRHNESAGQNLADSSQRESKMSTSFNTSRRNLFAAFKKKENVRHTLQHEPASTRPIVEVDLRGRNPIHSQSTLELSYAYPMTESSIISRSNSSSLPKKTGSHSNLPLPEIPNSIELTKNPSYTTLDQPDGGEDDLYDVPVFRQQKLSVPVEYEIPVSSLTSPGGLTLESSHVYECTDEMYSEID